jgi:hypothetical protein
LGPIYDIGAKEIESLLTDKLIFIQISNVIKRILKHFHF